MDAGDCDYYRLEWNSNRVEWNSNRKRYLEAYSYKFSSK